MRLQQERSGPGSRAGTDWNGKQHKGTWRPGHKDKSGMKERANTADIICTVIGCFCVHQMGPVNEWFGNKIEIRMPRQTADNRLHCIPGFFFNAFTA